jgi:dTDP-4-dehydrorhamnose reductase
MEQWLMAQPALVSVLRLTKVIAGRLPVLDKWAQALGKGESIEAFTDLVFAPLPLPSVLEALEYLGNHKPRGIFNLSGAYDVTYHEVACALAASLDVPASKVMPASALDAGIRPRFLPRHGTLKTSAVFSSLVIQEPMKALGL